MNRAVTTKYQPSINEWYRKLRKLKDVKRFRAESDTKDERLEFLWQTIKFPCQLPVRFEALDLVNKNQKFQKLLKNRGHRLCAIRLKPKRPNLPKYRKRGLTLSTCYRSWFLKLKINYQDYYALIYPHIRYYRWSTLFVVKPKGIFGEIATSEISDIMYGRVKKPIYQYFYDYQDWHWPKESKQARKQVTRIINYIKVPKKEKQNLLKRQLQAKFYHNYLAGYFEAIVSNKEQVIFVDHNRVVADYIPLPVLAPRSNKAVLQGASVFPGRIKGRVVLVNIRNPQTVKFSKGSILVCDNTDIRFLPLMKKAGAIMIQRGAVLSHAAIVARELQKPCIVQVKNLMELLTTGERVEVDAYKGIIRKM